MPHGAALAGILLQRAIVCGPSGIDIVGAFDRAKNIIALDIQPVPDVAAEILSIFRDAQSAECLSESATAPTTVQPNKLRREYYCWLSGVTPGGRISDMGAAAVLTLGKEIALAARHKKGPSMAALARSIPIRKPSLWVRLPNLPRRSPLSAPLFCSM